MGRPKGKGNTPREIREEVRLLLYLDDKLTGKELQNKIDKTYSVRTYQKIKDEEIPTIQKKQNDNLDTPWHINCTPDLSAEAISHILEVQQEMPKITALPPSLSDPSSGRLFAIIDGQRNDIIPNVLTVREAKWVARLYAIKNLKKISTLRRASEIYALAEIFSEIVHQQSLSTLKLDAIVMGKDVENKLSSYFQSTTKVEWLGLIQEYVSRVSIKSEVQNERLNNHTERSS